LKTPYVPSTKQLFIRAVATAPKEKYVLLIAMRYKNIIKGELQFD